MVASQRQKAATVNRMSVPVYARLPRSEGHRYSRAQPRLALVGSLVLTIFNFKKCCVACARRIRQKSVGLEDQTMAMKIIVASVLLIASAASSSPRQLLTRGNKESFYFDERLIVTLRGGASDSEWVCNGDVCELKPKSKSPDSKKEKKETDNDESKVLGEISKAGSSRGGKMIEGSGRSGSTTSNKREKVGNAAGEKAAPPRAKVIDLNARPSWLKSIDRIFGFVAEEGGLLGAIRRFFGLVRPKKASDESETSPKKGEKKSDRGSPGASPAKEKVASRKDR